MNELQIYGAEFHFAVSQPKVKIILLIVQNKLLLYQNRSLSKLCFFGPKYRLRLFPMDGTPMAHTYLQRFSYIAKVPRCRMGGIVPPPLFLVQSWRKTVFRTPDVCPPLTHACLGTMWGAVFPSLGPDLAAKRLRTSPQKLAWATVAVCPLRRGAISRKTSKMAK